jgi:hypothetical protein
VPSSWAVVIPECLNNEKHWEQSSNVLYSENGWILRQFVLLSAYYFIVDLTTNSIRVTKVNLAIDQIGECRCTRIFNSSRVSMLFKKELNKYNLPSKSAIKVLAPLFKAFITIFLSVGPVISTRRSSRQGAGGAHCQEGSARI